MRRPLRIGTRASTLARWQANWVADRLTELTGTTPELVLISTHGDRQTQANLADAGEPGVFTKEIQRALLAGEIDLTVHSLKDLPTQHVAGIALAAVPERESPADALVARDGRRLDEIPAGGLLGTGSLRRRAQLLHERPDLRMADIRGNVETRLAKLDAGQFDAIVLAQAGLRRLDLERRVTEVLSYKVMLPAVGQGALGIEARDDDASCRETLASLDHRVSHSAVLAERSLLATVMGGCLAPVGALATSTADERLHLQAIVCSLDGQTKLAAEGDDTLANAIELGKRVAEQLLELGAAGLLQASRSAR
jgi:hydroxymethylbilane synthase